METYFFVFCWIMLPFLGTCLGASVVFCFRKNISANIEKILLGFSAGVMFAASIWSLIIPGLEFYCDNKILGCFICVLGFVGGVLFLQMSKVYISSCGNGNDLTAFAITLHNIPEGMAVGVAFAEAIGGNWFMAISLAIGIAIQNIPEGATISLPFRIRGKSKLKSFGYGVLSGAVEPIFALITLIASSFISSILPFLLAFAAGTMIYVTIDELIPEIEVGKKNEIGTLGFVVGFLIMMCMDNLL